MAKLRIPTRNAAVVAVAVTSLLAGCGIATQSIGTAAPGHPTATTRHHKPKKPTKKQLLLHPKHKYFGVFIEGAPDTLAGLTAVKTETGKEPNLDTWYQAWGATAAQGVVNFDSAGAKQACAAGILPMLTWESWDPSVRDPIQGAAYAQPKFAAKKIVHGRYDKYIRNTAKAIKKLNCPLAIRFDQEQNGYWYPWGLRTQGMGSLQDTPKEYGKMWRHVEGVFKKAHVHNVLWVWSPNFQGHPNKKIATLHSSYPGSKYVDWVGMDGYYLNDPKQTFKHLFGSTMRQLKFAKNKPWIVSETAVGSSPQKPAQIRDLLKNIIRRKAFNGMIYFDSPAHRSDWRFDETPQSLKAFKHYIDKKQFGHAKKGSLKHAI